MAHPLILKRVAKNVVRWKQTGRHINTCTQTKCLIWCIINFQTGNKISKQQFLKPYYIGGMVGLTHEGNWKVLLSTWVESFINNDNDM